MFRVVMVCLLLSSGGWAQEYTFIAPDVDAGMPVGGGEVEVGISFWQHEGPLAPIVGFSAGVAHDPGVLDVVGVVESGVLTEINNGT